MPDTEPVYTSFYSCPSCGEEWSGEWDSACDDDCPSCGQRHVSPYFHVDGEEADMTDDDETERAARLAALLSERAATEKGSV